MAPRKINVEVRFWSNVDKSAGPSGCWPWTGYRNPKGYGILEIDGRLTRAHRLSFQLARGKAATLHVLHRCDNPPCVNPDHLFEGTDKDNLQDMSAKGRSQWQQKTHCPAGHPYSPENTYLKHGWRECRACGRERARARYHRVRSSPPEAK